MTLKAKDAKMVMEAMEILLVEWVLANKHTTILQTVEPQLRYAMMMKSNFGDIMIGIALMPDTAKAVLKAAVEQEQEHDKDHPILAPDGGKLTN